MPFCSGFHQPAWDAGSEEKRAMKIDFDMLDRLEAAGATAKVVIELLRTQHLADEAKKQVKRPKDKARVAKRRAATKGGHEATPSDTERHAATLDDTPRARLFRECVPAMVGRGVSDGRARALLGQWLNQTHDDEQLVTAAVRRACEHQAADVPAFVRGILKGKVKNGNGASPVASAFDDLIARAESVEGEADHDAGATVIDLRAQGR